MDILIVIMTLFSVATRAFTATTTSVILKQKAQVFRHNGMGLPRAGYLVVRPMSSSAPEDTSIVDVCSQKIKDALEASHVKVTGAYGDPNGSHISIEVVSSKFTGKRAVQRQQLVYKAIWEELQGPVHAVDAMICKTPEEA